jgi:DNA-binding transcriptional LysR family regulator
MNLRQLRYFVTVAEELHFGRAARRLAISQPPLSQQIIALERELGVRLLERTQRKVALTAVGTQWLEEVRRVLAAADGLSESARRLARGDSGSVSLAFVSTADYGALPELLRRYRARHPTIQVNLREATSDVQIDALLSEQLDVGLVIPPRVGKLPASLAYLPLSRERLLLALPEAWIASRRVPAAARIDLKSIAAQPLIIFPRRSAPAFYDTIIAYYARCGAEAVIGQEAIQMQTIVSLVSAGMGVALVPESLRNLRRTGVVYRDLRIASPQIETGLLWRRQQITPALQAFLAVARELTARPSS